MGCVRVVLALSDAGRRHVEDVIASWDLIIVSSISAFDDVEPRAVFEALGRRLGAQFVALPDPAASPPPGAIGYWTSGADVAFVVLTASGERRFVSFIAGVRSTNAMGIVALQAPSLLG